MSDSTTRPIYDEVEQLLNERATRYNHTDFIETDPIQIPHRFTRKEDIEIAAFLSATIAWGNRKMIIKNATKLMGLMNNSPYEFVMNAEIKRERFANFAHRTFNAEDAHFFVLSLSNIYKNHGGLEAIFAEGYHKNNDILDALSHFRTRFLELAHSTRVEKHVANIAKNSSAKRLNMFLRWLVRKDNNGVDFGLWDSIPASALLLPLDVHTGEVSRALGILKRKQNDLKSVIEVTEKLRTLDPEDPIKYDFALFGIGAFEKELLTF